VKILIADDDLTSRTLLEGLLKNTGHQVTAAVNGAEAWRILQQPKAPMLVILDWVMPEMDGLEVVRRVRAERAGAQQPYVLLLTSKDAREDIVTGLEAGANDYLPKPFDPGELRARVEVGRRMVELQAELAAKIAELRRALDQINTLHGIIPICSGCKRIRDDKGYWSQVEAYLSAHTDARFSHSLCPECLPKFFPNLDTGKPHSK
jgi:phosphoserine phosphatase RsbU/P